MIHIKENKTELLRYKSRHKWRWEYQTRNSKYDYMYSYLNHYPNKL